MATSEYLRHAANVVRGAQPSVGDRDRLIHQSKGLKITELDGERDMHMGKSVFVSVTERDVEHNVFQTQITVYIAPTYNSEKFELALQSACHDFFGPKPPPEVIKIGRRLAADINKEAGGNIGFVVGTRNTRGRRRSGTDFFDVYEIIIEPPHSKRYRANAVKTPFLARLSERLNGI